MALTRPSRSRFRRTLASALPAAAVAALLALGGCGGGGGGGGGGDDPPPAPAKKVVVSGTVREVSGEEARTAARGELPAVPGARVEVQADLDGDGVYARSETFAGTADDAGFFAVSIPGVDRVGRVAVQVGKPGYSTFLRSYEGVEGSLVVAPSLSEGEFTAIDLSGVAASPSRAGRMVLDSDELVTLSLVKDRATGRRVARVARGAGPSAEGDGTELVRVAFPLRGLDLPAGSGQIFADVAYLDTVNDGEVMPGGFKGEGEGETPIDVLATYGASQIKLYDADGKELMTDPTDRSKTIRIKMVVPPEAYETIYDEDPSTPQVEIPLYYYDEAAATWKLHKNADRSTAYGWLEDGFGNRLSRADLAALQAGTYAPGGAAPADVVVYGVGTVHHFTTWNCDRAGRSSSMTFVLKDKNGKDITADVRYRKKSGGNTSDSTRPRGGKGNLHTDYDRIADSMIKKLLNRAASKEERSQILRNVQGVQNPYAKQALVEALRRYAENLKDDIAGTDSDLERGLRAIFNNKSINDAFIDTDGLDCTKAPDLCNGVLSAAASTVDQSKSAEKAVKVLMEIAVDAYNPGKPDFDYMVTKGIDLLDALVETDGVKNAKDMKQVYDGVKGAKELAEKLKEAKDAWKASNFDATKWKAYWDLGQQFKDALNSTKDIASTIGGRMSRAARAAAALTPLPAQPATVEEGVALAAAEIARDYEDLGGVLLGASRYDDAVFGYWQQEAEVTEVCFFLPLPTDMTFDVRPEDLATFGQYCVTDPSVIAQMIDEVERGGREAARAAARRFGARTVQESVVRPDLRTPGGGEVGVLEYFDGTDWVPVPGRSDLGTDAAFVPVPRNLSFGAGTPDRPMMFLGSWTLDVEANVDVTGRILTTEGRPARNAVVYVGGQEFRPDAEGRITGKITAFATSVEYRVAGSWGGTVTIQNGAADLGTLSVPEAVLWNPDLPGTYDVNKGQAVGVNSSASALSGDPVTYTFRLYRNYWYEYYNQLAPLDEQSGLQASYTFDAKTFDQVGTYYLDVTATSGTVSARRLVAVQLVNQPPAITDIAVVPASPKVGDEVRLTLAVTDPDGAADLNGAQSVFLSCTDAAGLSAYPWVVREGADWVLKTDNVRDLYRWDAGDWTCTAQAWATDVSWGYGIGQKSFPLATNPVAPEVVWSSLAPTYTVGYSFSLYPAYLAGFDDKNADLSAYEVDCGNGTKRTSTGPIAEACTYDAPGDYVLTYRATDKGGRSTAVTSTIHYLAPLRMAVTPPAGAVPAGTGAFGSVFELGSAADAGKTLSVAVLSDNTDAGYAEGQGTLTDVNYTLTYQAGTSWWPQYLALWQPVAGGTVPIAVDKPGTYSLTVQAVDAKGMWANFPYTFQITAPFDGAVTVDGKTPQELAASGRSWSLTGDALTFDVTATGPEGWSPVYAWTVDGAPASTQKSFVHTFDAPGDHVVRLVLSNAQDTVAGRAVVRELSIPVYAPLAADFVTDYVPAVEGEVRPGDGYAVSLDFPDGQDVTAAYWTVLKDGSPTDAYRVADTLDFTKRTFFFADPGTYQIRVDLVDGRGVMNEVTWDQPVTVALHAPVVTDLAASKTSGRPPLAVTFSATATDADARPGETLRYQWSVDGQLAAGATGATFSRTFAAEGTYTVRVVVTDASGLTADRSVQVVAFFAPPSIAGVQAVKSSETAPSTVTFTATASDPDGTIATYTWYLKTGDAFVQKKSGSQNTYAATFNTPGTYTVKVVVTDDDGKTAEKTVTVTVYDASQATASFEFRERRADGFGPAFDFTGDGGPHQAEGGQMFAKTTVADVNVTAANLVAPAPRLGPYPVPGFFGTHQENWGSPSDLLLLAKTPATYTIGLNSFQAGTFAATETLAVPVAPGPYTATLAKKNAMIATVRDTTADLALTWGGTPLAAGQVAMTPGGDLLFHEGQAGHTVAVSYRYRPSVVFPAGYACGYVNAGSYTDSFGLFTPETGVTARELYLTSDALTASGQMDVVAMLGNTVVDEGGQKRCVPSYYGFVSGTGDTLSLPGTSLATKPLRGLGADVDLYDLVSVSLLKDGLTLKLDKGSLDTSAEDDLLVPYVPGADYRVEIERWVNGTRWLYATTVPAASAAGTAILVDVSGIAAVDEVTVQNADPSSSLRIGWKAGTAELWTSTLLALNGGTGPVGQTLKLTAPDATVELRYRGSDNAGSGRSFVSRQASSAFNPALDLASPAVTSTLTGFQLSVDEAEKILTVQYQTNAELCAVSIDASYSDPSLPTYGTRSRSFAFVADGSKTSYTVAYPIPEMANPFDPNPIPAIDALVSVEAEAHCGKTTSGYGASLAGILGSFPQMGYLEEELFLEEGGMTEAVGVKASWHKTVP